MKANDRQVGGDHYRMQAKEHWDYVIEQRIPYLEAMIIKYVSRWGQKGGIQDIDKAEHFLQKLMETHHPHLITDSVASLWRSVTGFSKQRVRACAEYIRVNSIDDLEGIIITNVSHWRDWDGKYTLLAAQEGLNALRREASVQLTWIDSGEPQSHGYVNQD